MHVSAVQKDPKTYEHIDPEEVGNSRNIVVSDQSGQSNIMSRLNSIGIKVEKSDPKIKKLLDEVKDREFIGYSYDGADASFELLARRIISKIPRYILIQEYDVSVKKDSSEQIISYVNTNLVSHMILTKLLIPKMKKHNSGKIIFIGSEAALRGGQKGSLYNAVKFGLRGFSQAVREECSGSKVHVSLINPGMVRTNFFEKLNFSPGDDPSNAIEASDVAQLVLSVFEMRDGTVIDEINLSPLNKVIKFNS